MSGRKKKIYSAIMRPIDFKFPDGTRFHYGTIKICCPKCGSDQICSNGTRPRKGTRVEYFQCRNPACLPTKKCKRQFSATSSFLFVKMIHMKLLKLSHELLEEGVKYSALAEHYALSISEISKLRSLFQTAIANKIQTNALVEVSQPDKAIAMDETYFQIEGMTYYAILATGYKTHKCLGLKISKTRSESDMKEVFNEADRNTTHGIETITADALNATQAMAKNIGREITLVIHKHKTPYEKVVIRHFHYTPTERITGEIGVKKDVFLHRKTKEFHWRELHESLLPPIPKKIGRPRGKSKPKKKHKKPLLKRGRKGLFTVFDVGKKAYLKAYPGRSILQIGKNVPTTISDGLHSTFELFAGMSIQNNLSEHLNSLIKQLLGLSGPKQASSLEKKLRITLRVWNQPAILDQISVQRQWHGQIFLRGLNVKDFMNMSRLGWNIEGVEKTERNLDLSFA